MASSNLWLPAETYPDQLLKANPKGKDWLEGHRYLMRCSTCNRMRWYNKSFVRNPFDRCPCQNRIQLWQAVDFAKVILDMANKEGETDGATEL